MMKKLQPLFTNLTFSIAIPLNCSSLSHAKNPASLPSLALPVCPSPNGRQCLVASAPGRCMRVHAPPSTPRARQPHVFLVALFASAAAVPAAVSAVGHRTVFFGFVLFVRLSQTATATATETVFLSWPVLAPPLLPALEDPWPVHVPASVRRSLHIQSPSVFLCEKRYSVWWMRDTSVERQRWKCWRKKVKRYLMCCLK